ncbi:hypothetical protein JTT00_05000 [Clostridium botulinum]|nr:hypothetical protein [Clostridium botulinum]MCS4466333.1 hypothetical protein [Clostridium botulinum]MCS4470447.1 hypothetical protein [Clostridium botulinum]MCS4478452.1 hypothetical protein [Clostridium botulinum]MCS4515884.1 hypothetical protein [Clostridium botulinum]
MNKLKEQLINYRELTLEIIQILEKEDYDAPKDLLNERQNIINNINKLSYTKEEFKNINYELDLMFVEKNFKLLC